ncbi:ATP-dependent helicase [Ralstonia pickettii]|uniref:ATP-dependent helicase n=1 Tax=Ralstonia pickettii TaxID=329 RepID=UPI0009C07835|nr:ATP-dependent helicase [Ralstonia pickettii]
MTTESDWSKEKLRFLASEGHVLALGGPGAGKTHVALVKARDEIRAGKLMPSQKIVFLSFARPTVARILEKAGELVSREELKRLEINTYHGFAWNILRSHGYLLNAASPIRLLPPPEAAAHLADIPADDRPREIRRLFDEEGKLHFDLFARLVAQLLQRSTALASIYCSAFPIILLDEFQDTNADEWAMIQQLGRKSRLIALADPEQRIYEFRGADPNRLAEFVGAFAPDRFDFSGENFRSNGTDITTYGNDLLTGQNRQKKYKNVRVVSYGFYQGKSQHFQLKTEVLRAIQRLHNTGEWSLAVLVPSKPLMLQVSDYLSSASDGLPAISHDVAMDTEPPALAASVIAVLLEGGSNSAVIASRLASSLHAHIRGRNGNKSPAQSEMQLADAIGGYLNTGKIKGKNRQLLVDECQRIAADRMHLQLSGDPEEDWRQVRALLGASAAPTLARVAEDAKFLRLLHRGSALRVSLSALWKTKGGYAGAELAVRDALLQEHFAAAQKDWRGIHLMTIHKAKGKEFDEVIIYEGRHVGRISPSTADAKRMGQALLALRVAVTRAKIRATIMTPKSDPCPLV